MTIAPGVRFCSAVDGTRLAYSVTGSGPKLAFLVLHNTDADLVTPGPVTLHWLQQVTNGFCVLRFDVRGAGLSERRASSITLGSCVDDLATVAAAAGFERFSTLALGYGVNLALGFAAAEPGRIERLACYGGAARGRLRRELSAAQADDLRTVLTMLSSGHDASAGYSFAFRRMFYEQFWPDISLKQLEELDRIVVARFSGAVARAYAEDLFNLDQSAISSQLRIPTLVVHATRDQFCPVDEGQRLAALIPGAMFVGVDSNHSFPMVTDADWPSSARLVRAFLEGSSDPPANQLTERQVQVLRLVAQGHTDKQIARQLGLSHRTIEMHVARSLTALGCRTRAEAVARSSALGLL